MKISYLHIQNYKQFSDLELDLTYPAGHAKAGQPLDKICIIGQSGTGKTNLLDIIKKSTIDFSMQPKNSYLPFSEFAGKDTDDRYIRTKFKLYDEKIIETLFACNESTIHGKLLNPIIIGEKIIPKLPLYEEFNFFDNEKNYFVSTAGHEKKDTIKIDTEPDFKNMSTKELENIAQGDSISISDSIDNSKQDNFIDRFIVNINESDNSWKILKVRIDNYETEKKQYENKLFKEVRKNPKNAEKMVNFIEEWEKENENILGKIADDINSIIKKFNLELQIDEDTQSYEELKFKDLSNNTIIEYDDASTGTKNLLSTFIPLKSYKPKDSIILIDEPEMSFYPDMQRQLVDLYTTVGGNNQLILATHSPLIASSFEPWEVVELKFDTNNQIYREPYYEGDNHVDHYTVDPRMLTWTGILTDVFDLQEDSNFSFREKKLMEYATLKSEIKQMKNKDEKEKAFEKLKNVGKILGIYNQ